MKNLEIDERAVRKAYRSADKVGKDLLENLFGKEIFNQKITERIKTFEDALEVSGRPSIPKFNDAPKDLRTYFQAQYKAIVIAEAINEGWKAEYFHSSKRNWVPWFDASSGFAFHGVSFECSYPNAGRSERLCLKSEELAKYAGKQFAEIYRALILT